MTENQDVYSGYAFLFFNATLLNLKRREEGYVVFKNGGRMSGCGR